jgi:hypothetical protein
MGKSCSNLSPLFDLLTSGNAMHYRLSDLLARFSEEQPSRGIDRVTRLTFHQVWSIGLGIQAAYLNTNCACLPLSSSLHHICDCQPLPSSILISQLSSLMSSTVDEEVDRTYKEVESIRYRPFRDLRPYQSVNKRLSGAKQKPSISLSDEHSDEQPKCLVTRTKLSTKPLSFSLRMSSQTWKKRIVRTTHRSQSVPPSDAALGR